MIDSNRVPRVTATCFVVCLCFSSLASATEFRPQLNSANHLQVNPVGDALELETTGHDPFLVYESDSPITSDLRVLEFDYFATQPIRHFGLYHGPPLSELSFVALPNLRQAETWHRYTCDLQTAMGRPLPEATRKIRLDFGNDPGARLQIRGLTLRALTAEELNEQQHAAEIEQRKQLAAKQITAYLGDEYAEHFSEITASASSIVLDIAAKSDSPHGSRRLVEFAAHQSPADAPLMLDLVTDNSRITLPRFVGSRDRLTSGFAIASVDGPSGVETLKLLSPRTHTTKFNDLADAVAAPPPPTNQKGLGGLFRGPESDLSELGITAVTMNLMLNPFISDRPGRNREKIPVAGDDIYFSADPFAEYDALMRLARQHELVVSAIVLIGNPSRGSERSPLVHPDADGGVYGMPDLSSERGVAIYSYVLDRIAQRYRDPASDLGCIANWIAHNEVDFHSVWTNMGSQPRAIAMETTYRSMRIIHNVARAHQPRARVFVSLTHHWVVPDDGLGRQLSPREMLETMTKYSRLEGDFAWGVAYHPYPQSLFAEVSWRDASPTNDFETPLITIQNLPVLQSFLEQPSMRDSRDRIRPVILSEQGFHTKDESEASQRKHAASLLFAMDQVRKLSIVESFHYHRWVDHPLEGGLNLGLRTQFTSDHPQGQKKMAWELYRAVGTENESKWRETLPMPPPDGSDGSDGSD